MHLSLISDAYLSDVLDDAGRGAAAHRATGRAHHEALLRGIAALAIAGVLLGLAFLSSAVPPATASGVGPQSERAPAKIFNRVLGDD